MKNETKFFTIFSQGLAGQLMIRGFVLAEMSRHKDGSGRNVYHFYDSLELRNAIKEITKK